MLYIYTNLTKNGQVLQLFCMNIFLGLSNDSVIDRMQFEEKYMRLLNISDILIIKYCVIEGIGVRLVNGTTYNEGRIEIYHANEWGSICDNTFDKGDGQVVCRMLGLDTTYVLFL